MTTPLTTMAAFPERSSGTGTTWNTKLPTQTVVGWTTVEAITDAQIDELLRQIAPHLFTWGLTSTVSPQLPRYRKSVREWMTNL